MLPYRVIDNGRRRINMFKAIERKERAAPQNTGAEPLLGASCYAKGGTAVDSQDKKDLKKMGAKRFIETEKRDIKEAHKKATKHSKKKKEKK